MYHVIDYAAWSTNKKVLHNSVLIQNATEKLLRDGLNRFSQQKQNKQKKTKKIGDIAHSRYEIRGSNPYSKVTRSRKNSTRSLGLYRYQRGLHILVNNCNMVYNAIFFRVFYFLYVCAADLCFFNFSEFYGRIYSLNGLLYLCSIIDFAETRPANICGRWTWASETIGSIANSQWNGVLLSIYSCAAAYTGC